MSASAQAERANKAALDLLTVAIEEALESKARRGGGPLGPRDKIILLTNVLGTLMSQYEHTHQQDPGTGNGAFLAATVYMQCMVFAHHGLTLEQAGEEIIEQYKALWGDAAEAATLLWAPDPIVPKHGV